MAAHLHNTWAMLPSQAPTSVHPKRDPAKKKKKERKVLGCCFSPPRLFFFCSLLTPIFFYFPQLGMMPPLQCGHCHHPSSSKLQNSSLTLAKIDQFSMPGLKQGQHLPPVRNAKHKANTKLRSNNNNKISSNPGFPQQGCRGDLSPVHQQHSSPWDTFLLIFCLKLNLQVSLGVLLVLLRTPLGPHFHSSHTPAPQHQPEGPGPLQPW